MINSSSNKGVILDLDGTCIRTESLWVEEQGDLFSSILTGWTREGQTEIIGMDTHRLFDHFRRHYNLVLSFTDFQKTQDDLATRVYENCEMIDGMDETLEEIAETGVPIAIATSARSHWVDSIYERLGFDRFLDRGHIVTADCVPPGQGKPNPTPYNIAAKRIEVQPTTTTVTTAEDSYTGSLAAVAAQTHCIGFQTEQHIIPQDLSVAHEIASTSQDLCNRIIQRITS